MTVARFISICVVAILLLITVGVLFLYFNRNEFIKEVMTSVGSDVLGAEVSVGSVDLDVFQYSLQINQFSIQNPEGFPAEEAIAFETIFVALPQSFSLEPIHIKSIAVREPYIHFIHEQDTTNLNRLIDNAKAYIGPSDSDTTYLIKIDDLLIEEPKFAISTHLLPVQEVSLPMPSINIKEIGHPNGMPPGELAGVLLSSVLDSATEALSSQSDKLLKDATQMIEGLSNDVQQELDKALDTADDLFKEAGKLFQ